LALSTSIDQERERRLVLASQSPRRQKLLEQLGFHPVVRPASVPEERATGESPELYTRRLSQWKAASVADEMTRRGGVSTACSPWVLAADTVVVLDETVLEKPQDEVDAQRVLRQLSGLWHTVVTAFTIRSITDPSRSATRVTPAEVLFKTLSDGEIDRYVASGDPMDKAGAYGIQGLGSFLVREIRGSYFTVVGLPICEVVEELLALGAISGFPFPPGGEWC
jgi:septum formation protein